MKVKDCMPVPKEAIAVLQKTPPPAIRGPMQFLNKLVAQDRIAELERSLGLAVSPAISNLGALNARVQYLEGLFVARNNGLPIAVPGQPGEPALAEALTPALPAWAEAAPAPVAPIAGTLDFKALVALSNSVIGNAPTAALIRNDVGYRHGAAEVGAARDAAMALERKHGTRSPEAVEARKKATAVALKARAEREGTEQQQMQRLAQAFLNEGLRIPGFDYRTYGMKPKAQSEMSAGMRAAAQRHIDDFFSALSPSFDPVLLQNPSAGVRAALKFLAQNKIN